MPAQAKLQVNGTNVPDWSNYTVEAANLSSNDFKGWAADEHYYGCDNPVTPYTILDKPTNLQQAKCQLYYIKDTLNSLNKPASGTVSKKLPPAKIVAAAAVAAAGALPPGPDKKQANAVVGAVLKAANETPGDPLRAAAAAANEAQNVAGLPGYLGAETVSDAAAQAAASLPSTPPPPAANGASSANGATPPPATSAPTPPAPTPPAPPPPAPSAPAPSVAAANGIEETEGNEANQAQVRNVKGGRRKHKTSKRRYSKKTQTKKSKSSKRR